MKYLLLIIIIAILYYIHNRRIEIKDKFQQNQFSDCSLNFIILIYNKIHKPIIENIYSTINNNKDLINCIIENNEKCEKNQITKSDKFNKNNLKLNLNSSFYNNVINTIVNNILNDTYDNINNIINQIASDLDIVKTDDLTNIVKLYLHRVIVNNLYFYNIEIDEYEKKNQKQFVIKKMSFAMELLQN